MMNLQTCPKPLRSICNWDRLRRCFGVRRVSASIVVQRTISCLPVLSTQRVGSPVALGVLVGQTKSPTGSDSRFVVPALVCHNTFSLPLQALLDSGAKENFLDEQVATQAGFRLEPRDKSCTMLAMDGRLLATVTHRTEPLTLIPSGNHRETIQFYILTSPTTLLILGFPWLSKHNPHIDWSLVRISSWSSLCHSVCLQSALVQTTNPGSTPCVIPEPLDLSNNPEEYHDLQQVFSKA